MKEMETGSPSLAQRKGGGNGNRGPPSFAQRKDGGNGNRIHIVRSDEGWRKWKRDPHRSLRGRVEEMETGNAHRSLRGRVEEMETGNPHRSLRGRVEEMETGSPSLAQRKGGGNGNGIPIARSEEGWRKWKQGIPIVHSSRRRVEEMETGDTHCSLIHCMAPNCSQPIIE